MTVSADFSRTQAYQREASDPRASAWVIANAGAGKTHVLTQRVIRLLLAGVDPASILCLTFTRIAAAEMARRVFQTLGEWTMLDEAKLAGAIAELEGRTPTPEEMRQARRLFAKALETPGGLKIQTIHAFCERLLHEFPFEANVPGQFSVMDESAAAAALARARADVMNQAAADRDSALGRAVRHLAEESSDQQIGEALDALIRERDALRRWMERSAEVGGSGSIDDALIDLRVRLNLADGESEDTISREICDALNWGKEACQDILSALTVSANASDRDASEALRAILAAEDHKGETAARVTFFLTGTSELKGRAVSRRFGAETRGARPTLAADFEAECVRILQLLKRRDTIRAYGATAALLVVGDAILATYHVVKRQAGALDFPDLIAKARNLLSRADAAQWVLYKLDRRVEHILVDEAQDTSPDQWMVVKAIAEDFFSGEGATRSPRTIFAVGDDKQSIFGFQGAAPEKLVEMQRFFKQKIEDAGKVFVERPLFLSFRSTTEVLDSVDKVFNTGLAGEITASTYSAHSSNRPNEPGYVILLPRIVRQKADPPEEWMAPYDAPRAAETQLAERIAEEIAAIRNTILPSGKRLRDGQILVLVRRRDAFAAAMNRALRNRLIPTAGADRIPVSTHIAVLDLLALADVMLLPEDDLQLASLLKSPLLGMTENELMDLALKRQFSLWSALRDATGERLKRAAERLMTWRRMADQVTPFRFLATILGPHGGRRAFRARLGSEADDVLDTFLSQALAYESVEAPSLQGFVRFVRANESDIKREAEEGASGVRVMTVHGAKGLEADVVFLVDTGGLIVVPGQRDKLVQIGERDDPAFLWRRLAAEQPDAQRDADGIEDADTKREYLRLLYVAMTRARDLLYVAGIKGVRTPDDCWYSVVANALLPKIADGELEAPYQWPESLRPPLSARDEEAAEEGASTEASDWLHRAAPTPVLPPQPLRPSSGLADPDPIPVSAQATRPVSGDDALLRGRAVHLMLQYLPAVPASDRAAAANRLLAGELGGDGELIRSFQNEAEAALQHPKVKELFGPESRAEVEIVGNVATERGPYAVSGRIDRLARDLAGWRLVDFKTDRSVPAKPADADPGYILQMALYRKLLMEMEPGTPVEAMLVYTAGPNLMPIPPELMERALVELGVRVNPFP